jgi:hypothetical protein
MKLYKPSGLSPIEGRRGATYSRSVLRRFNLLISAGVLALMLLPGFSLRVRTTELVLVDKPNAKRRWWWRKYNLDQCDAERVAVGSEEVETAHRDQLVMDRECRVRRVVASPQSPVPVGARRQSLRVARPVAFSHLTVPSPDGYNGGDCHARRSFTEALT